MTASLYRTDFPNHCRIHAIDGLLLVFHRPSGTTHFLDSPVPEMLEILALGPLDPTALHLRLCEKLGAEPDGESMSVVAQRLDELVAAGLVHAA